MKKLMAADDENIFPHKRNFIVEPTIEALQKQRSYHITQVEFHQNEITGLDRALRKYKEQKENETVGDNNIENMKEPARLSLQSGQNQ